MSSVLEMSPLTRVEGHGRVIVYFDGSWAEKVELALIESPRLFEALLVGKSFREVPEIICHICSICSTVHKVAALMAIEKAFGVEVSPLSALYRELIVLGGHIQSHALHLFCLVLPDYLDVSGVPGLAGIAPAHLKMGLRIKAAGNLLQETIGGRLIHPVTLVPGGISRPVPRGRLLELKVALTSILPDVWACYELFRSFPVAANSISAPCFLAVRSAAGFPSEEALLLGNGKSVPVTAYREILQEQVVEHSHAKSTTARGQPLTTGALARLNLDIHFLAKSSQAMSECRDAIISRDIRANNLAQAVELVHAVERSLEIIDIILTLGEYREKPVAVIPRNGGGSSATEAPRGVLVHSYQFDGKGFCKGADIITPTAINQAAMEQDLLALARQMQGADRDQLTSALEQLVRSYDPCISCAVHLVDTKKR